MHSQLIREAAGERTWVVVFDPGDEALTSLRQYALAANLTGASLTAIGAFSDAVLGFFDPAAKKYIENPVREQVEVLSLIGNVALHKGQPKIHAHVVVAKRDGSAMGGHLLAAHVRPTLEVIVVESPHHLRRVTDEATGLALLQTD